MIQILKTNYKGIEPLRFKYLRSLPEFQELYLELMAENADYYLLEPGGETAGYAIVTSENILVEFFVKGRYIAGCHLYFDKILSDLQVKKVYCKSFDSLLLNCCLERFKTYKSAGTLFRDFFQTEKEDLEGITIRVAEQQDIPFLLLQKDGLYETPDELKRFVSGKNISLFLKEDNLLGCSFLIRVCPDRDYYDIGMWVNPDFRRQGIATKIISYLKETCLSNGWKPICGCAYENIASRKALEKNGFFSKYKLLEFELDS